VLSLWISDCTTTGNGSGLRWILAGRQPLPVLLDPSIDQFLDSAIGGVVTGLLQPLNISSDQCYLFR
jgi:hypothetical protein